MDDIDFGDSEMVVWGFVIFLSILIFSGVIDLIVWLAQGRPKSPNPLPPPKPTDDRPKNNKEAP